MDSVTNRHAQDHSCQNPQCKPFIHLTLQNL